MAKSDRLLLHRRSSYADTSYAAHSKFWITFLWPILPYRVNIMGGAYFYLDQYIMLCLRLPPAYCKRLL